MHCTCARYKCGYIALNLGSDRSGGNAYDLNVAT